MIGRLIAGLMLMTMLSSAMPERASADPAPTIGQTGEVNPKPAPHKVKKAKKARRVRKAKKGNKKVKKAAKGKTAPPAHP